MRKKASRSPAFSSKLSSVRMGAGVNSSRYALKIAAPRSHWETFFPALAATIRIIPASSEETDSDNITRFVLFSGKWAKCSFDFLRIACISSSRTIIRWWFGWTFLYEWISFIFLSAGRRRKTIFPTDVKPLLTREKMFSPLVGLHFPFLSFKNDFKVDLQGTFEVFRGFGYGIPFIRGNRCATSSVSSARYVRRC